MVYASYITIADAVSAQLFSVPRFRGCPGHTSGYWVPAVSKLDAQAP
jgi:hypothetical protein